MAFWRKARVVCVCDGVGGKKARDTFRRPGTVTAVGESTRTHARTHAWPAAAHKHAHAYTSTWQREIHGRPSPTPLTLLTPLPPSSSAPILAKFSSAQHQPQSPQSKGQVGKGRRNTSCASYNGVSFFLVANITPQNLYTVASRYVYAKVHRKGLCRPRARVIHHPIRSSKACTPQTNLCRVRSVFNDLFNREPVRCGSFWPYPPAVFECLLFVVCPLLSAVVPLCRRAQTFFLFCSLPRTRSTRAQERSFSLFVNRK